MTAVDRFIRFGLRVFSPGRWHRVPFQPILYLFLWSAAVRIIFVDGEPIPFQRYLTPWADIAWNVISLTCPPLALLSWWMLTQCRFARVTLAGLWVRLAADFGQFVGLLTFHVASAFTLTERTESHIYARYAVAACMAFTLTLVLRDLWAIAVMDRLARHLDE